MCVLCFQGLAAASSIKTPSVRCGVTPTRPLTRWWAPCWMLSHESPSGGTTSWMLMASAPLVSSNRTRRGPACFAAPLGRRHYSNPNIYIFVQTWPSLSEPNLGRVSTLCSCTSVTCCHSALDPDFRALHLGGQGRAESVPARDAGVSVHLKEHTMTPMSFF